MRETLEERIARIVQEHVSVVPYNPEWPPRFERERNRLLHCLPEACIRRIEHFGSTAVPGMPAKPIIDILVEVTSLEEIQKTVVPLPEARRYEYFWRPTWNDGTSPFYAWFIKRDSKGARTHHIHMVEKHFEHWDRLLFRDYLRDHPKVANEYLVLKLHLASRFPNDRVAYTKAKTEFIVRVTRTAKEYCRRL